MPRSLVLVPLLVVGLSGCSLILPDAEAGVAEMQLAVGQCIENLDDFSATGSTDAGDVGDVGVLPTIDCAEPHEAEVYFAENTTASSYTDAIVDEADQACYDAFATFVGVTYDESRLGLYSLYPSQDTWDAGDRQIACVIVGDVGETFTGTLKGAAE